MPETGFWWTHWGHLLTKPLVAVGLWLPCHLLHAPWGVGLAVALGIPLVYSAIRKARRWPGSLRTAVAWRDELADAWAAGIVVLPLVLDMLPLPMRLAVGALMAVWFGAFLHRWALP